MYYWQTPVTGFIVMMNASNPVKELFSLQEESERLEILTIILCPVFHETVRYLFVTSN